MKSAMWSVVVLVVVGSLAAIYFYYWRVNEPPVPAPAPSSEVVPAPKVTTEPMIHFPVRRNPSVEKPLPSLSESDPVLQDELFALFTRKSAEEFFDVKEIARRFVVTVDSLPRQKVPMQYRIFKPVVGKFLVTGEGENYLTTPDNARRYTSYIWLADAVDAQKLVAAYFHFYPLFQQEYQNLGYPHGYFNDRLVEAIDDMLAAPDVPGRIKLVRPNVLFQFADPDLEALSAGQKIMIRLGSENALRMKARLRDVRRELTSKAVQP